MKVPFMDTLLEMRAGKTHEEMTEKLHEVVHAVRESGKVGELTLKITVRPFSKGNTDTLNVEDEIKMKCPELDKGGTVFFATPDDNLSRRDPSQNDLFINLKSAPETQTPTNLKEA